MRLLVRRSRGARRKPPTSPSAAQPQHLRPSDKTGIDEEDRLGYHVRSCRTAREVQILEREIAASSAHRHSTYLANLLIQMYAKCASVDHARRVFDGIATKNRYTYNLMLTAYSHADRIREMEGVFSMISGGDTVAWNTMIAAYARVGHLELAKSLFDRMNTRDDVSWNALISGYARHGNLKEAKALFDVMLNPGVVVYTAMIQAYAQGGHIRGAKKLFDSMPGRNSVAWVTMLQGYVEIGEIEQAWSLFSRIPQRGVVAESIAMVAALAEHDLDRAKQLFLTMRERNVVTWTTMVSGFASGMDLRRTKRVFDRMPAWGTASFNSVLVAMAQSGRIEQSLQLFSSFPETDLLSWTTMVASLAHSGHGRRALDIFQAMVAEGFSPDAIAFISVLNACSHVGVVEDGIQIFIAMIRDFEIIPWSDHYVAMVDLMSRAGQLENALELIQTMPFLPDSIAWGALLAGARTHRKLEFAEVAAARVAELDTSAATPLVALAGTYSAAGRPADAARIRELIRERGLSKLAGLSSVEIGKTLHRFAANDTRHARNAEIREEVERIHGLMKAEGYVADTSELASKAEASEEEKCEMLKFHSERMAVALAVLEEREEQSGRGGAAIRVMKNLRVCCDCHTALKLMAKVCQRRIVVRDTSRFHHFDWDGSCSCGDYW